QQIVTVTDNELPTIVCPTNVTVSADTGLCTASGVNLDVPTSNDNCTVASVTNDAVEPFALGDTIVTWTVTDGSGNSATCEQTVTVTDNELPTIICPPDITVNADSGLCSASNVALGDATGSDNCSVASIINNALEPFPLGDTTVTWTITDGSGNTATCEQTVTVIDGDLPEIVCPDNLTVNTDLGSCTATNIDLGNLDAEDCTSITITN
ncbi:HYR domain-containing protein, partial [Agrococcus terreus]